MSKIFEAITFYLFPFLLLAIPVVGVYLVLNEMYKEIPFYVILLALILFYPVCVKCHLYGWRLWLKRIYRKRPKHEAWALYDRMLKYSATGKTKERALNIGVQVLGERSDI